MNTIFTVRKCGTKVEAFDEEVMVSGDSIEDILRQLQELGYEKVNMQEGFNPFVGSKVQVVKRVKQETYDKQPEKYQDFSYNTELGADYNEFYKLLVDKDGKGLLIRLQAE
jgi:phosphosulfolactate synthase (CoM biosynthesis protein A)